MTVPRRRTRRALLRTCAASLPALGGCAQVLGEERASDTGRGTTAPDGAGNSTPPRSPTPPGGMSDRDVAFRVEATNETGRPLDLGVSLAHTVSPYCTYATPQCQQTAETSMLLDTQFDLAAGDARRLDPVGFDRADDGVEWVVLAVERGSRLREFAGLERAGDLPDVSGGSPPDWRFAEGVHDLTVTVDGDGVRLDVRRTD